MNEKLTAIRALDATLAGKDSEAFEPDLIKTLSAKYRKEKSNARASFLWESSTNVSEWISTGSILLDVLLSNKKNGGVPVGRLTEISGYEGTGKSLLASYIIANTQKMGGVGILIDTEHAASMEVMEACGVDVGKLIYVQAGSIEEVFQSFEAITDKIQSSGKGKLITIVWDSVAATSTKAEIEGDYDDNTIGMAARVIGRGLRKFVPVMSTHRVCLVFLNQLRMKIGGVAFGDNSDTPGGKAIPFHSSIRLRLNHFQQLKDNDTKDVYGKVIKIQVKKNKVAPPMREAKYSIRWGGKLGAWIDETEELLQAAVDKGIFTAPTNQSYEYKETPDSEPIRFTKKKWLEMVKDESFFRSIRDRIEDAYIITNKSMSSMDIVTEDTDEE